MTAGFPFQTRIAFLIFSPVSCPLKLLYHPLLNEQLRGTFVVIWIFKILVYSVMLLLLYQIYKSERESNFSNVYITHVCNRNTHARCFLWRQNNLEVNYSPIRISGGGSVSRGNIQQQVQLLQKERRGYSHFKEEALDRTVWRARFGRGFGPVVRQTAK